MLRQCRAFNQGAGADFTSKFAKVGSELTPKGASSQSSEASKQLTSELAGGRTMSPRNYGLPSTPYVPPPKPPSRLAMTLAAMAGTALLALLLGALGFAALVLVAWLGPVL